MGPGSAKLFASLGFEALATTSSGSAATLGLLDGSVSREGALAGAAAIVEATELPVSADLENGFGEDPEGVAETIRLALAAGLAGASIEDYSGREDKPIYPIEVAAERVAAAAEAAHYGRSGWSSPRGRRITCTGSPTSPTRSPACGLTRRLAPTSSTPPASPVWRTSARSSTRSVSPSTSWHDLACPR